MFGTKTFKNAAKWLIIILALTLILSFLAHDIIPHNHPHEIFGSGLQAAFHGNDRKWWYLMLLVFIFAAGSLAEKQKFDLETGNKFFNQILNRQIDISKLFDPLLQALRSGILNPKLCD